MAQHTSQVKTTIDMYKKLTSVLKWQGMQDDFKTVRMIKKGTKQDEMSNTVYVL